jgi:hypothetical protein
VGEKAPNLAEAEVRHAVVPANSRPWPASFHDPSAFLNSAHFLCSELTAMTCRTVCRCHPSRGRRRQHSRGVRGTAMAPAHAPAGSMRRSTSAGATAPRRPCAAPTPCGGLMRAARWQARGSALTRRGATCTPPTHLSPILMCNPPTLDPLAPKGITNSIAESSYIDIKLFGHDNPQEGGERGAEDEAPMHASGGK